MNNALKVEFPIYRTVVCGGYEVRKVLYKGDTVKCPRCGQAFEANSMTTFQTDNDIYLTCPKVIRTEKDEYGNVREKRCNYKFSVIYAVHREVIEEAVNERENRRIYNK